MDRTDGGDHGDLWRTPRRQLAYLPRAVGAHLGDKDPRPLGQVLVDRARQTRAIIETARRCDDSHGRAEQGGEVVLGGRLAVRAGNRHHARRDGRQPTNRLVNEALRAAIFQGLERSRHQIEHRIHRQHQDDRSEERVRREGRGPGDDERDDRGDNGRRAKAPRPLEATRAPTQRQPPRTEQPVERGRDDERVPGAKHDRHENRHDQDVTERKGSSWLSPQVRLRTRALG